MYAYQNNPVHTLRPWTGRSSTARGNRRAGSTGATVGSKKSNFKRSAPPETGTLWNGTGAMPARQWLSAGGYKMANTQYAATPRLYNGIGTYDATASDPKLYIAAAGAGRMAPTAESAPHRGNVQYRMAPHTLTANAHGFAGTMESGEPQVTHVTSRNTRNIDTSGGSSPRNRGGMGGQQVRGNSRGTSGSSQGATLSRRRRTGSAPATRKQHKLTEDSGILMSAGSPAMVAGHVTGQLGFSKPGHGPRLIIKSGAVSHNATIQPFQYVQMQLHSQTGTQSRLNSSGGRTRTKSRNATQSSSKTTTSIRNRSSSKATRRTKLRPSSSQSKRSSGSEKQSHIQKRTTGTVQKKIGQNGQLNGLTKTDPERVVTSRGTSDSELSNRLPNALSSSRAADPSVSVRQIDTSSVNKTTARTTNESIHSHDTTNSKNFLPPANPVSVQSTTPKHAIFASVPQKVLLNNRKTMQSSSDKQSTGGTRETSLSSNTTLPNPGSEQKSTTTTHTSITRLEASATATAISSVPMLTEGQRLSTQTCSIAAPAAPVPAIVTKIAAPSLPVAEISKRDAAGTTITPSSTAMMTSHSKTVLPSDSTSVSKSSNNNTSSPHSVTEKHTTVRPTDNGMDSPVREKVGNPDVNSRRSSPSSFRIQRPGSAHPGSRAAHLERQRQALRENQRKVSDSPKIPTAISEIKSALKASHGEEALIPLNDDGAGVGVRQPGAFFDDDHDANTGYNDEKTSTKANINSSRPQTAKSPTSRLAQAPAASSSSSEVGPIDTLRKVEPELDASDGEDDIEVRAQSRPQTAFATTRPPATNVRSDGVQRPSSAKAPRGSNGRNLRGSTESSFERRESHTTSNGATSNNPNKECEKDIPKLNSLHDTARSKPILLKSGRAIENEPDEVDPKQAQREREYQQRQRLKEHVAKKDFDGHATTDFYGFGKVLGQGSFGKVRLAWHRLAGCKVAIKSYEKSKMKEPQHWKRVQQEIKLMEKLNHPYIVRMLEMIDSPKRIHIVMEYAGGGNLCNYVKSRKRLPEPEARRIFIQILLAAEYMHECNMIHRDVKLENVLFDHARDMKLVDFGFSVVCKDMNKKLKVFCGTPSYMAPEIVQRKEYLGRPVDVWSLGVLLYACLCGYFPFVAKTYPELYKRIASGQLRFPDHLSNASRDLLRRMMHPDPLKRLTLTRARRHPWTAPVASAALRAMDIVPDQSLLINRLDARRDLIEAAVRKAGDLGFRRDELIHFVSNRGKNAYTATYYLLLHRYGRKALLEASDRLRGRPMTASSRTSVPLNTRDGSNLHANEQSNVKDTENDSHGTFVTMFSGQTPVPSNRPITAHAPGRSENRYDTYLRYVPNDRPSTSFGVSNGNRGYSHASRPMSAMGGRTTGISYLDRVLHQTNRAT